eukprot:gene38313-61036_t
MQGSGASPRDADLPFAAGDHAFVNKGGLAATVTAASPCVAVVKETVSAPPPEAGLAQDNGSTFGLARDLLVTVRVFRSDQDETASQDPRAMGFRFEQLYPLLRDAAFWAQAVGALRARGIFDRGVWGYGFLHGDAAACRELLCAEKALRATYAAFLRALAMKPEALDAVDRLRLCYYLVCQDRIGEARAVFDSVGAGAAPAALELQRDYMAQ